MAADPEGDESELVPAEQVESGEDGDLDEWPELVPLLQAQLDIERRRIESNDRRTETILEAVRAADAAVRRQHDFQIRRLENEEHSSRRRHQLTRQIVYWGGASVLLVLALLLAMLFFGDEGQIESALAFLKVLGIALGGGGVLHLLHRVLRWLFER